MAGEHPEHGEVNCEPELTFERLSGLTERFRNDSKARLAQNAVTQTTANDVAMNREVVVDADFSFSHVLDDWAVTNQKRSGRCWMFAALNLLRANTMTALGTKDEIQFLSRAGVRG